MLLLFRVLKLLHCSKKLLSARTIIIMCQHRPQYCLKPPKTGCLRIANPGTAAFFCSLSSSEECNLGESETFRGPTPRDFLEDLLLSSCFGFNAHAGVDHLPVMDRGVSLLEWKEYCLESRAQARLYPSAHATAIVHVLTKHDLPLAAVSFLKYMIETRQQMSVLSAAYLIKICGKAYPITVLSDSQLEKAHVTPKRVPTTQFKGGTGIASTKNSLSSRSYSPDEEKPDHKHSNSDIEHRGIANDAVMVSAFAVATLRREAFDSETYFGLVEAYIDTPLWRQLLELYNRLGPNMRKSSREVTAIASLLERLLLEDDLVTAKGILFSMADKYGQNQMGLSSLNSPLNYVFEVVLKYVEERLPEMPAASLNSGAKEMLHYQDVTLAGEDNRVGDEMIEQVREMRKDEQERQLYDMVLAAAERGELLLSESNAESLRRLGKHFGYEGKMTVITPAEDAVSGHTKESPLVARCSNCSTPFPKISLTDSELDILSRAIQDLLVSADPGDSAAKQLQQFLGQPTEYNGPRTRNTDHGSPNLQCNIDYVVDGLNVAGRFTGGRSRSKLKTYVRSSTFSEKQLADFLSYVCLHQKKRVLVVGTPHLSNIIHSGVLKSENFQLYCSGRRSEDDLYSLLSAVLARGSRLVSNDFFGDHVAKLPPTAKYLFKNWQRSNQVGFVGMKGNGEPWLVDNDTWFSGARRDGDTWHLPLGFQGSVDKNNYTAFVEAKKNLRTVSSQPPNRWLCLTGPQS